MNLDLDQIACCLNNASRSLSAGQVEQGFAHLTQAGSILDQLTSVSAVAIADKPTVIKKSQQSEAPRALSMTA